MSLLVSNIKFDIYFSTELILCINAFGHNFNSSPFAFEASMSHLQRSASLFASIIIAFTCCSVTLKQNNDYVFCYFIYDYVLYSIHMTICSVILLDTTCRVICLSDLGIILAYYQDKTTLISLWYWVSNCPCNMPKYNPGNMSRYYSTKYHYRNLHDVY